MTHSFPFPHAFTLALSSARTDTEKLAIYQNFLQSFPSLSFSTQALTFKALHEKQHLRFFEETPLLEMYAQQLESHLQRPEYTAPSCDVDLENPSAYFAYLSKLLKRVQTDLRCVAVA